MVEALVAKPEETVLALILATVTRNCTTKQFALTAVNWGNYAGALLRPRVPFHRFRLPRLSDEPSCPWLVVGA